MKTKQIDDCRVDERTHCYRVMVDSLEDVTGQPSSHVTFKR